ncbi:hypothetical protein Leryth_016105, partial [Lithospermum erythrorhizon]
MATTASYYIASPRFSMFNNHWEGTNNKNDYLSLISKRKKNISRFGDSDQQSSVVKEE